MYYKTAAYVYLVALTMTLLFTTSQAEFDIEKGKETIRKLFNKLIRIVLEYRSYNLDGLIRTAGFLVNHTPLENSLVEVAQDSGVCQNLSDAIDFYESNFRKLVKGIREGVSEDQRIPIIELSNYLRAECTSRYQQKQEITSQTAYTLQDVKISASLEELWKIEPNEGITLKRLLEADSNEIVEENPNVTDKSGFQMKDGILEVKILLDTFLKLALDKKCTNLETLKKFVNSMVQQTSFYKVIFEVAPRFQWKILRYIRQYESEFEQILKDGGETTKYGSIPMEEELGRIWFKSADNPSASSSSQTMGTFK